MAKWAAQMFSLIDQRDKLKQCTIGLSRRGERYCTILIGVLRNSIGRLWTAEGFNIPLSPPNWTEAKISLGCNSGRFVKCRFPVVVASLRRVHSSFEYLGNVVQVVNAFWSTECVLGYVLRASDQRARAFPADLLERTNTCVNGAVLLGSQ